MRFLQAVTLSGLLYTVSAAAYRTGTLNIDFADFKKGENLRDYLFDEKGLIISDYLVGSKPLTHTFTNKNVAVKNGKLQLKVNKGAAGGDVKSAEVTTIEDKFVALNITTRAKAGRSAGVCSGFFTYRSDSQEADIEILTSYINKGYGNAVKPGLELTNQPTKKGGKSTNTVWPYPWHPADAFHDYQIEWKAGAYVKHYVDGKLINTFTKNVPTQPSSFIWNSWSSGDPMWSAGPPTADNILEIESIHGWWQAKN